MTSTPRRIRDAVASDAATLARIKVSSWRITYAGIVPAAILERLDVTRNEAIFTARIAAGEEQGTLVIEDDAEFVSEAGPVVGYALVGPCTDAAAVGLGEVQAIYLDPDARGQGFGRALLEAALSRLSTAGFSVAVLWVLTDNHPARRFYERNAFAPDGGARILDFDGTPIEEIRYRRPIA